MVKEEIHLEDLGYNSFFETNRHRLGLADFSVARVISEHKEAYRVKNTHGEFFAKITGTQMFEASGREDFPAVGDWVAITELDKDTAVIRHTLPRATVIKRTYRDTVQIIATNIDVAFVVESVDRDYSLNRFERYFAMIKNGGVKPVIVLNKVDVLSQKKLDEKLLELKDRFPHVDIMVTSTTNNEGLDALKSYITTGTTYCFLGSSGVGKSSLINVLRGNLLAGEEIKTGDINAYSGRGKHVTTSRHMYFLPAHRSLGAGGESGGMVIDNPGMREVGVADAGQGVDIFFDEVTAMGQTCRYIDCTHTHEPGCKVIEAVQSGKLDAEKYANYITLKKEADYNEMNDVQKREKSRQFGKFKKNAIQELKDFGHKNE